jgi:hypothetical protein
MARLLPVLCPRIHLLGSARWRGIRSHSIGRDSPAVDHPWMAPACGKRMDKGRNPQRGFRHRPRRDADGGIAFGGSALRDVGSPGTKACNDMRRAWVCSGWPDRISSLHGRVPRPSREGLPTPGNKKAGTLSGIPAFLALLWSLKWWRWGESNPRPKARDLRYYMLSTTFVLGRRQHDVRSTPADTPALFKHRLAGRRQCLFRDDDPTPTSTDTSGFGAYALSGESVVVVVGN